MFNYDVNALLNAHLLYRIMLQTRCCQENIITITNRKYPKSQSTSFGLTHSVGMRHWWLSGIWLVVPRSTTHYSRTIRIPVIAQAHGSTGTQVSRHNIVPYTCIQCISMQKRAIYHIKQARGRVVLDKCAWVRKSCKNA